MYENESYESSPGDGEGSFCFPAISDARSLAWGCLGDECGDAKHAGVFKQLLFVSGNRGVTVHAFSSKQMTDVGQDASRDADGGKPLRTSQVVFEKKLVLQAELEKGVMDLMGEEGWVAQIQV